jgi:hypothetical protein
LDLLLAQAVLISVAGWPEIAIAIQHLNSRTIVSDYMHFDSLLKKVKITCHSENRSMA